MKQLKCMSLLLSVVVCAASLAFTAEHEPISSIVSPGEKQMARQHYVETFKRIGLNTTPGDARFLRIMIEAAQCKRGVEVGTATGYGALLMGMAFEQTGGHLYTIDIDPKMVVAAREHIDKMDLADSVTVIEGDALKVLPELEGKYDFLFIDALKQDYFNYFKAIAPKLAPGAVIIADNVIKFENQMKDFLEFMENDPHFEMQVIQCSQEKGDGMAVIIKR